MKKEDRRYITINFEVLNDFQFKEYFLLNAAQIEIVFNSIGRDTRTVTGRL